MTKRVAALALLALSLLAPRAASAQTIDKIWSWNIGSTTAGLSMQYDDKGLPTHVWFDLGSQPALADARRIGEFRNPPYGRAASHATLADLRPNTVYYFRATVSTPRGKAVSGVSSFRTKAAAALARPSIRFDKMTYYGGQLMFDFTGNGYGAGGTMYMLWSTDPRLAHPTRIGDDRLVAGPTGQQMHKLLNPRQVNVPNGGKIYFQGVIETPAGKSTTPILSQQIWNSTNY